MMRIYEIVRMTALGSSMESLSYQFLQRCSVSGTAKGKAKTKEGKTLKRSKLTTKKGGGDSVNKEGEGGPRRKSEFDGLIDECLASAPPIRSLKPKEKAREDKRQRMGLKSKAMEEQEKKWKKMKKDFNSPFPLGTPGLDLISLGLVDADKIPAYELTVEDGRRLAKEYSRYLMRKHRARQAAESAFLRCKKEAIEALPDHLKAAALVPDFTPFPVNRFMATLTPPIEGYMEKVQEAYRRSAGKEKLR